MKGQLFIPCVVVIFLCLCMEIFPTSVNATTDRPSDGTPATPAEICAQFTNNTCEKCLGAAGAKCYYCTTDKKCALYPKTEVLPTKYCSLSKVRWGLCWMNFEALIISMSVIGGVLLIALCLCIYCCCCRCRSNKAKYAKEDATFEHKKAERKMHHEQKKADRKAKNDEIRRKYGLMPEDEGSYHRFEETA